MSRVLKEAQDSPHRIPRPLLRWKQGRARWPPGPAGRGLKLEAGGLPLSWQIISALEADPVGQKMQLACRLQQIAALVENKVTDL